ncbi:MAG: PD-(D/E)XK motif protein [Azonexus sp.]
MEAGVVTEQNGMDMRWDLLESDPPSGERLRVRVAVPSRCADVFIAMDAARKRYILVRIPEGEPSSLSERTSRGIAVQTVEMRLDGGIKNGVFVEIACLEQAGYAALDIVTGELVEALLAGASIGRVRLVQSVLSKWRRFWAGVAQNLLTKEQLLGLFGELWFLSRWLLPSVGLERGMAMWRGPAGARNDFELPSFAIEVKTSGKLDGSHVIHGLEQLLEPVDGVLLLFCLKVRDEASGIESLPKLVNEIRGALSSDHALLTLFESMLLASGYEDPDALEYEKVKFRIRGQGLYRITPGFPRLIPSSLIQGVPVGVGNVSYELRLDAADEWLLSESPAAVSTLLKDMADKVSNQAL